MMDVFVKNLHRVEKVLTSLLEGIVTVFFFIILTITVLFVVLRYGFNESIIGGDEAMEYLFIYTTAIGAAISVAHREHIKITYFLEKLPVWLQKIVDSLGLLLVAFLNGIMIWLGIPWIQSVGSFESPVLRIPNRFIQMSIPIGCSLVIVYCVYHILLNVFEKPPITELR
jgi:TRAP-type C4-dicarboxylate transport system permease small subunit